MTQTNFQIFVPQNDQFKPMVKFLNKVFHKKFARLIPKLYRNNPEICAKHYAIKKDGKFIGAVGIFPSKISLGDQIINGAGVGMVATAKSARGSGVMSSLLNRAISDLKNTDCDVCYLSGQRQRYQHFGFYPAGQTYKFLMTKDNCKKCKLEDKYTFKPIKNNSLTHELLDIYNQSFQHFDRPPERFFNTLITWKQKASAVYLGDTLVGYVDYKYQQIDELILKNDVNAAEVVFSFLNKVCAIPATYVSAYLYQTEIVNSLSAVAENVSLRYFDNVKIVNFRNFTAKILNAYGNLWPQGTKKISINIEGIDNFTITFDKKFVASDMEGEPDFTFTEEEFTMQVAGVVTNKALPFKLPFGFPHIDNV